MGLSFESILHAVGVSVMSSGVTQCYLNRFMTKQMNYYQNFHPRRFLPGTLLICNLYAALWVLRFVMLISLVIVTEVETP